MKKRPASTPNPLQAALQAFQSGRLDRALAECLRILQQNPNQFDALSLAGQIRLQQRCFADAVKLLSKADSVKPGDRRTVLALAQAYRGGGLLPNAARCLESLCYGQDFERDTCLAAANAWLDAACIGNALALLLHAAANSPRDGAVLARLAHAQRCDGQYAAAQATLEQLLEVEPDNRDAWLEKAELMAADGNDEAANAVLQRLIAVQTAQPVSRLRLARSLFRLGRHDDCLRMLETLLDEPEIASLAQALFTECCVVTGRLESLARLLQGPAASTAIDPAYLANQARAALVAKDYEAAGTLAAKARRLGGHDYRVMGCLIESLDAIGTQEERLAARLESYGYLVVSAAPQLGLPWLNSPSARCRVAFLTARSGAGPAGDWRALLTASLAEAFEVYCYFSRPQEGQQESALRSQIAHWRNVADLPDAQLAALIRQDRIDILIDCDGHHHDSRLPALCMKPAPVQISLAGDSGTGMDCIDYRMLLPDRSHTEVLPCVEPLLGGDQPIEPDSLPSLLLKARERWCESQTALSARRAQSPAFEQAFAAFGLSAAEQAFRDRSDMMGLNGSRRYVRAAALLGMRDYCSRHDLPYRQMQVATQVDVEPPRFFGFPAPEAASMAVPEAYLAEVRDAVVFADNSLVLLPGHEAVLDMALNGGAERFDFRSGCVSYVDGKSVFVSAPVAGEIRQLERGVFLGGPGAANYYHWLIEIMSRMAWVDECSEYDGWPLLVDRTALSIPQHVEILNLINRSRRTVIYMLPLLPYRVDRLCVPSHLAWLPYQYRQGQQMRLTDQFLSQKAINYLRRQLLADEVDSCSGAAKGTKRLFISRRATAGYRHLLNEAELETLFAEFGFEPIRPELLSVGEQIKLFSQAEVIAGQTGAGMTNILFAPDHAKIICFMPRYLQEFASFSTIAAIRGLQMLFLDGSPVKDSHRIYFQSDYIVDLQQARALLQAFCPYPET